MKDLDIVIYGATGFTGSLCVDYLNSLKKDLFGIYFQRKMRIKRRKKKDKKDSEK